MESAKQPANTGQNTPKGKAQAGLFVDLPGLRTMEFAHQMRDLLTVVMGSLEQLRRQPVDEHGHHQLDRAETAALRARDLLNRYSPLADPGLQDGHQADGSP